MAYGPWPMVDGLWSMANGLWSMAVVGRGSMIHGCWPLISGNDSQEVDLMLEAFDFITLSPDDDSRTGSEDVDLGFLCSSFNFDVRDGSMLKPLFHKFLNA